MLIDKIRTLCEQKGVTVSDMESDLGWNRRIYRWDENEPSVDKVKAVADYLGVTVDYLLSDESSFDEKEMLLQKAFDSNPDMRVLFKVAEKCSPAEIKTAIRLIEALRGESHYEDK